MGDIQTFRITEDDLARMERLLPIVADAALPRLDNKLRAQIRQIQQIVSNVRWGYGPPTHVEIIPVGDDQA